MKKTCTAYKDPNGIDPDLFILDGPEGFQHLPKPATTKYGYNKLSNKEQGKNINGTFGLDIWTNSKDSSHQVLHLKRTKPLNTQD